MISHEHKCIFIHINKCGGTSIDNYFNKRHGGHMTVSHYIKKYPTEFSEYFKFSCVRNPWDKLVSFYHFHKKKNWYLRWDWDKMSAPSFCEFVRITKDYSKTKQNNIFKGHPTGYLRLANQVDWLVDESGNLLVDYICRFEHLQNDFEIVCDRIGIPQEQLPHKIKSKHKHYTEYYDEETKQIVAEKYAKDINYFGYKFGK